MPLISVGSGKPPMLVCSVWRPCRAPRLLCETVREKQLRRGIFCAA
jgi:hypothetical protein